MSIRLNLGCGEKIRASYINIDIRDLPGVDLIADVEDLPVEDGSVDEILAVDIYEHIPFSRSRQLLSHWWAKLKNGGLLKIQIPSLDRIFSFYQQAATYEDLETVISLLYGAQDYPENYHYTVGHPALLAEYLRLVGFKDIQYKYDRSTNLIIRGFKKENQQ